MQHVLTFRDPTGRVYMMNEAEALPPLADGYEWTVVVRPAGPVAGDEYEQDEYEEEPAQEPAPASAHERRAQGGILDALVPLLTPRDNQSATERAQELIDALPEEIRGKLAQLIRALAPPRPRKLPPFPEGRQ